jgi:hypothetical protein
MPPGRRHNFGFSKRGKMSLNVKVLVESTPCTLVSKTDERYANDFPVVKDDRTFWVGDTTLASPKGQIFH